MAETTVTGRIGDQDVNLINAASEATLQKLLEAMNRMASAKGGAGLDKATTDKTKKLAEDSNKLQETNNKHLTESNKQYKENNENLKSFGVAIANVTGTIGRFAGLVLGTVINSVQGLATELLNGGERVSDFTKHLANIPVVGSLLHSLATFIDKTIDQFRTLSDVGAAFNNNVFEMRLAAANAAMPMEEFAALIASRSQIIGQFGDTVTNGARQFGVLSKNLREGKLGQELMGMGYTMSDLNEALLTYKSINSALTTQRRLGDAELLEGTAAFAKEMDLAAKASGISRKALMASTNSQMMDAQIRAVQSRLSGEQLARSRANYAMIEQQLPGLANGFKDLADGVAQSEEGQMLQILSQGEFGRLAKQAAEGQIDAIELNNRLVKLAPSLLAKAEAMGPAYVQALRNSLPGMAQVLDNVGSLATLSEKNRKKVEEEQKKSEAITSFFTTFEQLIRSFRGAFESNLLSSNIFKSLKEKMDVAAKAMETTLPPLLDWLGTKFGEFLDWFDAFLTDIGKAKNSDEIWAIISDRVSTAFKPVGDYLKDALADMFMGLFTNPKVITGLVVAFGAMAVLAGAKQAIAGKVAGALTGGAARAATTTAASTAAVTGQAAGGGLSAMLKGLASGASALANPMALVGLGALTLAIIGLAKAFEIASKGFEPFGNMVKSMLEGLDPVIRAFGSAFSEVLQGLGTAISNAKDGITAVFNGISTVISTIGSVIIGSINAIAGGIGTVIEKITAFKTAGITATTDQIERLSAIPSDNMNKAAAGIAAMKVALDGFQPGFIKGVSTSLGSLFGDDQATAIGKVAALGPQLDSASVGFAKFKDAINGLNFATLTFSPDQLNSLIDGTASLKKMSEQLAKSADTLENFGARNPFQHLSRVGDVAPGLNTAADSINNFKAAADGFALTDFNFTKDQLDNLTVGTKKLADLAAQVSNAASSFKKLDNTGLEKIKEGVEGLSKAFKDFNTSFSEQFIPKFEALKTQSPEQAISGLAGKLDQLNSNMTNLVAIQQDAKRNLDTIATKPAGNDMLKRR